MAGQSDLQSKRYFLHDETLQVTPTPALAPVTLSFANTIRVQVIATEDAGDITVNIGGQEVTVNASDGEQGGTTSAKTIYFDVRGTDCESNQVSYSATGDSTQVISVFYNLLKQVQR